MSSPVPTNEVVYFVICSEYAENGEPVCHVPLSPKFAKVEKAKAALPRLRRIFPSCRVWRYRLRFDPRQTAAMERRSQLLAELL